jgi:hypothetical protein
MDSRSTRAPCSTGSDRIAWYGRHMVVDFMLLLAVCLALAGLLARHWPRPVMIAAPVKNPCGFAPPA